MKIQPINQTTPKINRNSKARKNSVSFKSYEDAILRALYKDLGNRVEITTTVAELTQELISKPQTIKMPDFSLLQTWLMTKSTYLIEELCKPIAKIKPEFRNIIFKSQEGTVPILESDNEDGLFILNFGKHGFWNNLFNCESANNDMRLTFTSKHGTFELSTTKNKEIVAEQMYHTGYWQTNKYDVNTGERISIKTGNSSDVPVWVGY